MSRMIKARIELLKAMHLIMQTMNNEEAYFAWINTMPDEPQEDDFEFIAGDEEELKECVQAFKRIFVAYQKDGIYVGGTKAY